MANRTKTAPAPLPPTTKIKFDPPKETESLEMTVLADDLLAAGLKFPATIGTSPFLPPMNTENAAVKLQLPIAKAGGIAAKTTLLTLTRTLKGSIMGHRGWLNTQMVNMNAADATAYAVNAGGTTAKTPEHHDHVEADTVKNGPVGSLRLTAYFISEPGRCLSCTEYCIPTVPPAAVQTWVRGPDTELNHVDLPLVFTLGQAVQVRTRRYMRGTGYTPWLVFDMIVV